jgi:hypothetical protein
LPFPAEPKVSAPGRARAFATMSVGLRQGLLAGTTTMPSVLAMKTMGWKSASGS